VKVSPRLQVIGHRGVLASFAAATLAGVVAFAAAPAAAQTSGFETTMMDQIGGSPALGGDSSRPAVTQGALLVAFESRAVNLVIGDTNDARDIFVRHRNNGSIIRVTVSSGGVQANSDSQLPSIDSTGAYVVYESFASNLVAGDTNGVRDVFLRDTQSGTTTRVSRSTGGAQGNGTSGDPVISGNGRYIAFTSTATNLVPGDTNNANDIFVADRLTGVVSRVSLRTDGGQGNDGSFHPAISFDGRYVAFSSRATNLVSSDTNGAQDVFVYDRQTATVARVSVRSNGGQADGNSENPAIAMRGDGYVVAFNSTATNLVGNDTNGVGDVYVRISDPRRTVRASVSGTGAQGNGSSSQAVVSNASITTGSQYVAFTSNASNLVPGDTNNESDIFRYDLTTGQTCRFSVATGGGQGTTGPNGASQPAIDRAGHRITYAADFANLVPGDGLLTTNIFQTVDHGGTPGGCT
jgi:Tol biopolymer transport system component